MREVYADIKKLKLKKCDCIVIWHDTTTFTWYLHTGFYSSYSHITNDVSCR